MFGIPIFTILSILVDVLLVIHVWKTGRDRFWIYVLVFLPVAGWIAYAIIEIIPELRRNSAPHLTRVKAELEKTIVPDRALGLLESLAKETPTFQNLRALADEYFRLERFRDAADTYALCLRGMFADDVETQVLHAQALSAAGAAQEARTLWETLRDKGMVNTPAREISYANCLNDLGLKEEAEAVYRNASASGHLSARYAYARFLADEMRRSEAFNEAMMIQTAFLQLPMHAKRENQKWATLAQNLARDLSRLNPAEPMENGGV